MSVAAPLRIGVVGVGRIGALHAETLSGLDGVSLFLADADPLRAAEVAGPLRATAAASPERLIEDGIDALVIATNTQSHVPLLRLAALTGVPAFCEKPVALELVALAEISDEVEAAGITVQVGFQRRFDPGYRAARDAVASGELGNLLLVRAATHDPAPPAEAYIATSGGIFRDLSIHDFDAIRYVTSEEIVEVYADGAVRETEWFARHDDVDAAVAVVRLSGGALGIVSGARHDPLGYDVRLELFGAAESIVVGVDSRSPIRSVEPGATQPGVGYRNFVERFERAYREELAAFVETVRSRGKSACSLEDARAALSVAIAADRSRTERRPVRIEEVGLARMRSNS
jgi:myo-inositol 2-dehydrogenase / D-chiro-inositol 1-dehydrogenase